MQRSSRSAVRWRLLASGALVVLCVLLSGARTAAPDRFDVVVIDAGHGGDDHGASGPRGTLEKDLVLGLARGLGARLRQRGLRVVMTRDSDAFVPLERRTAIANDARGDLFLSIHANAAEDAAVRGSETYFLSLEASDAGAARVASRENSAFPNAGSNGIAAMDDPFIALVGDLITTEYMQDSNGLARLVQRELGSVEGLRSRGVKQAMFVVLTGVQMPAALVEVGFVTNATDERSLASARGRAHVVEALDRAVVAFGRRHDERRGLAAGASEGR